MKTFLTSSNLLTILLAGVLLFVYVGFFQVDESFFVLDPVSFKILRFIRIAFPLLAVGLVWWFYAWRTGRLSPGASLRIAERSLLCGLVLFFLASLAYDRSTEKRASQFHSFLQLAPRSPVNYDAQAYNIICLGGSTTEFRDPSGRDWPTMLERRLHENGLRDVRVYNLGRQWYTSQHILTQYIQNVRPLKPKAVIVMENINDVLVNADFSRFSAGEFRSDYGHFLGPMTRSVKYGSFSKLLFATLQNSWYAPKARPLTADGFPGITSYQENLRTLIALARQDGVQVIVMTQMNLYKDRMTKEELRALYMLNKEAVGGGKKWSYETAKQGLRLYNNKLREIAAQENVALVDLDKSADVPRDLDHFSDDVHYKGKTFDLIAERLSNELPGILNLTAKDSQVAGAL